MDPFFIPIVIQPFCIACIHQTTADPSTVIHDAPSALGVAKSYFSHPHHYRHRPNISECFGETLPPCLAFGPSLSDSTDWISIVRRRPSCV